MRTERLKIEDIQLVWKALETYKDKLAALKKLAREPIGKDARKTIVSALTGTNNILAAKAAELVGKLGLEELIPDLFLNWLNC